MSAFQTRICVHLGFTSLLSPANSDTCLTWSGLPGTDVSREYTPLISPHAVRSLVIIYHRMFTFFAILHVKQTTDCFLLCSRIDCSTTLAFYAHDLHGSCIYLYICGDFNEKYFTCLSCRRARRYRSQPPCPEHGCAVRPPTRPARPSPLPLP